MFQRSCCAAVLFLPAIASGMDVSPAEIDFFEKEVRPLLVQRCQTCHGAEKAKGGLRLTSRATLLEGGGSGPAAVPGKPDESRLVKAVRHKDSLKMPPKERLADRDIDVLARWVQMGLPWPEGAGAAVGRFEITPEQRRFWAFQPVKDSPPPAVKEGAWPLTPIDRFLLAKLETKGLRPAAITDKRTLIRRATFDLIGLPPMPAEIDAFLADDSPAAWEKVIDRLLASPHYGERWGRHWLDLVHYADTAGETADFPVPEAYRYRNYVIDAFNADKPYDEFLCEQVAGDLLAADGPPEKRAERIVATGYVAVARRFGFDPQNYHHLTIEDTIDTLGKTVLGLTVACARCHEHKFDPISRADYYALYGIFASTRYPFPGSEEVKRPRDFIPLGPNERAYAVADGTPANAHIQLRGDPHQAGAEAPRRFPEILGGAALPAETKGSGRLELARWLTDPKNPLTARVMVNRIWQQHFGRGLVRTPNNFGKQGQPPTHPELLDYLAARFVEDGWSVKKMNRRILLSRAYQLASTADEKSAALDPGNECLGHFERQRLDAESIRDALLAVGGGLDRSKGGAHPFPPENSWGFTQHNPFQAVYDTNRRSVYLMTQRIRRHPFLALFDGADPNSSTPQRGVTTVPTQALFFLNNPFVHDQAGKFADRLLSEPEGERIERAYRLALGRAPTDDEHRDASDYLRETAEALAAGGVPPAQRPRQAWAGLARVLFGSNEFIYVD
jgi:Protein of unknown function (DUF1553)/Protein of unknown function (DUF1549)/Planctomycete cytochrome C